MSQPLPGSKAPAAIPCGPVGLLASLGGFSLKRDHPEWGHGKLKWGSGSLGFAGVSFWLSFRLPFETNQKGPKRHPKQAHGSFGF